MNPFVVGQRWISETEPELGLATVVHVDADRIQLEFRAAGEIRTYAREHAPLKRVVFRAGDRIKTQDDAECVVQDVLENDGLLVYLGESQQVPESQLNDRLSLRGPQERCYAGQFDPPDTFELRRRTLELFHRSRRSPVRGFVGGRIDLIPHQLYIAHEVTQRHAARVMLSDEVGLGKTIEAGLILHRLLQSGRADRILVLVPESLVHQWFVEMLRRFNIWFHIFDEIRCAAIEENNPQANPFLDDQLILASTTFLASNPRRSAQAADAGWDVLVVDEAHHLEWAPGAASPQYDLVDHLSRRSESLLLLTATPEQLGAESHFARLRLLDPDRYVDFTTFQMEAEGYRTVARIAADLLSNLALKADDLAILRRLFADEPRLEQLLAALQTGNPDARETLLNDLLDLHGPGRVLFRNTRTAMKGFPKRTAHLAKLDPGAEADHWLDRVSTEFVEDSENVRLQGTLDLAKDPRVLWLVQLLQVLTPQKVLLIGRSLEKAEALEAALRRHMSLKSALFHEGLTLVQRDRNAAWFAEPEGARLLICSEIGSEGRNFQFAHHLVLFDLPLNPELLEQRIGRLDRIGQTSEIHIHIPYLANSPQEVLARWYHEGLNAFENNLEGGNALLRRFGRAVVDLALEFPVADRDAANRELDLFLLRSRTYHHDLRRLLEQGRDRLLELNSFRPAVAQTIIDQIQAQDADTDLEDYMLDVWDHYGVRIEELAPQTWHLNPQGVITDSFPSIPAEGIIATCDRRRAIIREDIAFLTLDHPMVTGAMELYLGETTGNCSFALLPDPRDKSLLLECLFVLEAVAAARLHADRFLPPTSIRLVLNHKLEEVSSACSGSAWERSLRKASPFKLLGIRQITGVTLPAMLQSAADLADTRAVALRQSALAEMHHLLGHEVERLKSLSLVNDHIRPREIELAKEQQLELAKALEQSRLRLDALRLIWKGPTEALY